VADSRTARVAGINRDRTSRELLKELVRTRSIPRLTYSNVIATLAIFIALGGISYAATNLSKNSVGTKQIKNNAVTSKKIKKNAVTAKKIEKNAVTTAKIKGKSITEGKLDPDLLASIDEEAKQKVLNADGSVLGEYAGTVPFGAGIAIFEVVIDGGLYTYYGSGQFIPLDGLSPSFKTNTCTGPAYIETEQAIFDLIFSKLSGGPSRVVFRSSTALALGPISAWHYTAGSEEVVAQNLWELETDGSCVMTTSSPYTGLLGELESVPAPSDGVGPLKIG